MRPPSSLLRTSSWRSDEGSHESGTLPPPILVYHESARSIVFRDHLRRAAQRSALQPKTAERVGSGEHLGGRRDTINAIASDLGRIAVDFVDSDETLLPSQAGIPAEQIGGYQPQVRPLPSLEFGPEDVFEPLLDKGIEEEEWSKAEKEVVDMLREQQACVKTIKNTDWTAFLHRFCFPLPHKGKSPNEHDDIAPDQDHPFNSFVTSCSLLPPGGTRMRCFGSTSQYTVGIVFALPKEYPNETEDQAAERTKTWAWPAGYAAKTEFNIDGRGRLTNGRQEALKPLSVLRQYNRDYLQKNEYMISTRLVSGLNQIPYNEVYLRVGGLGRIVDGIEVATGKERNDADGTGRSLDRGVGLPVALFVRAVAFGDLMSLLRTRARITHVLGDHHLKGIPLLMISPDFGIRVLTDVLQSELWKIASRNLNPFQNSTIAHKTTVDKTSEDAFQQKVEELFELDGTIQKMLTPEELARLAGGFGATDDSVATMLKRALLHDIRANKQRNDTDDDESRSSSHYLQDVVNEGLAAAVRAGDYHTSRQLLILYSLVASRHEELDDEQGNDDESIAEFPEEKKTSRSPDHRRHSSLGRNTEFYSNELKVARRAKSDNTLATSLPPPPPPPPLDTERLRSATNSDGLLAVLGAAHVLKSIQDGSAKRRAQEAISAVEEWVNYGEQSVAFRISSWYDQRAAQGDLQIASDSPSNFMAFVSNKAIANRKSFADQLRKSADETDFNDLQFLHGLSQIVESMHAPCLRLELLQYVLGLDNRYSIAHVARSIELAATCLGIATTT